MGGVVLKRRRREIFYGSLFIADFLTVTAAFVAAYWLRYHVPVFGPVEPRPGFRSYAEAIGLAGLLSPVVLWNFGLYQMRRGWRMADLLFTSAHAASVVMVVFLGASYLLKWFAYSRLLLGFVWISTTLGIVATRWLVKQSLLLCRARGIGVRRLVIAGDGSAATDLLRTIELHPELGYDVVGLLSPAGERLTDAATQETLCEGTGSLLRQLAAKRVDDVILTLTLGQSEELQEFIAGCQECGINVRLIPDLYQIFSVSPQLEAIENIPLLTLRHAGLSKWEGAVKRLLDLVTATVLLATAAPLIAVVAAMLRWRGGRVFEIVPRVGQHGVTFRMWRLALPANGNARASGLDEWMARYSVTEIPQLWNVIRGHMSLVGPRPESRERVRRYNAWHRRRLLVKPGVTGLAQVNGLRGFAPSNDKTRFDVQYIEHLSLRTELTVLMQTAWTILRRARRNGGASPVVEDAAEATDMPAVQLCPADTPAGRLRPVEVGQLR